MLYHYSEIYPIHMIQSKVFSIPEKWFAYISS